MDETVLRRMTGTLRHRGPDDQGAWFESQSVDESEQKFQQGLSSSPLSSSPPRTEQAVANAPGAALGHTRLSIIDLGGGHQPSTNEDHSVWIAFNGEIYNYRELRRELKTQGHVFRTDSDTEVIVHLYEQHGADCVDRLRGMFAFAIWDCRQRRLMLARDRMGQKPLFYTWQDGRLAFASELKALLQLPGLQLEVDPQAVDSFLSYQYVPHPGSILRGFHKLPPAHVALFEDGELSLRRYWKPGQSVGEQRLTDRADAERELREVLTEAVRLRLRSDVPLGAFLSGGVDSTIISGIAQQESDQQLQTFSIGFPVQKFDERIYAQSAAKHLGTLHHEQVVEPQALSILPRLIWHYDEPFADSSAIPTMALSQMTRAHVTVALSGDGGDELFAGYERYQAVRLAGWIDRFPAPVKRLLAARIWQRLPASVEQKSPSRRIKRLLEALGAPPERRYLRWISILDAQRRDELYQPAFRERLAGFDSADFILDAYRDAWPVDDFVAQTCHADMLTYLPCDILTKVDIASMSCGLECRSPFLDHHVVDLAVSMPRRWKLHGKQGKRILVEACADLIPEEIRTRRKMGFGVPLDHWFRDELRELVTDILTDKRTQQRGYFEPAVVQRLLDEHQQRQWDHSARLWTLLVLELWHRMFLDNSPPATCPASLP